MKNGDILNITVKNVMEITDDFQNVLIAKSGIHIPPKVQQLKCAERTINNTRYFNLYIIEPLKYYRINFNEKVPDDLKGTVIMPNDILGKSGLIVSFDPIDECCFIFNTTKNIIYIEKDANLGAMRFKSDGNIIINGRRNGRVAHG